MSAGTPQENVEATREVQHVIGELDGWRKDAVVRLAAHCEELEKERSRLPIRWDGERIAMLEARAEAAESQACDYIDRLEQRLARDTEAMARRINRVLIVRYGAKQSEETYEQARVIALAALDEEALGEGAA